MTLRNRAHGFTLIEIMIAVAIVAILAAIAMPAYSGYTIRSKVSECLVLSSGAKLEVSERRARGISSLAGAAGNFTGTRYCADMAVGEGGEIVMTTQATGAAVDPVLQLSPTGTGTGANGWTCGYLQGDPKHLPANCRNLAVAAVTTPAPGDPSPGAPSSPPVIDPFPSNPNPPTTPPAPPAPGDPVPADPAPTPDPTAPAPAPADPTDPAPPSNPPPSNPPPSDPSPTDPLPIDPPAPGPGAGPGGPGAGPAPEPIDDGKPGSRSWCEARPNPPAAQCGWMDAKP